MSTETTTPTTPSGADPELWQITVTRVLAQLADHPAGRAAKQLRDGFGGARASFDVNAARRLVGPVLADLQARRVVVAVAARPTVYRLTEPKGTTTVTAAAPLLEEPDLDPDPADASADPRPTAKSSGRVFTWVNGSEVVPLNVEWWETHLIPKGVLTVLAGRGNSGKSTSAAAWAAEETRHGGIVVWLHSEEDRARHIVPKLIAAGADVSSVQFLDVGIRMDDDSISADTLKLPRDLDQLETDLERMGCQFVVLDAITSFKPSAMSANNGDDVRAFLEPIQVMAGRLNAVVLGIAHLTKDGDRKARDAVKGASEWTDVPRMALVFHREDGDTNGVISDVKGNLSPSPRSIGYRFESLALPEHQITEVGRVVFTGDVDTNVDDARRAAASEPDTADDDRDAVRNWVEDYLTENGETESVAVKREAAKELGVSLRTVERAAKELGLIRVSRGFPRKAFWALPGSGDSGDSLLVSSTLTVPERVATVATGSEQRKYNGSNVSLLGEKHSSDTPHKTPSDVSLQGVATDAGAVCGVCRGPMSLPSDTAAGRHESCLDGAAYRAEIPGQMTPIDSPEGTER